MKKFLYTFIGLLIVSLGFSQSFKDSLKGFDEVAVSQKASADHLTSYESSLRLKKEQRAFINKKYNIIIPQTSYSFKTPVNNNTMSGNIDFESGNLSGWTITNGINVNSTVMGGCCPNPGGRAKAQNGGFDPKTFLSLNSPLGGNWVAKLNNDTLYGAYTTRLTNTISVSSANTTLKLAYMCVFNEATHGCVDNPYFDIRLTDTLGTTTYLDHYVEAPEMYCVGTNTAGFSYNSSVPMFYGPWKTLCVDLSTYVGSKVIIDVTMAECTAMGHWGYAYFDANLSSFTTTPSTFTLNSNTYPIVSNINSISLCGTTTATAIAPNGATGYTWSGPGITGMTTQSVSITSAGVYNLVYAKPSACSNTASITFSIGPIPTVSVSGTSIVCAGNNFTATASGASFYLWYNSSWPFYYITNPLYDSPTSSTTYTVVGQTAFGCTNSAVYNVTVVPLPPVSITGNFSICSGGTTTLTATGANTYSWNTGPTTSSISVSPASSTNYNVVGTDLNGCKTQTNQVVTVQTSSISAFYTSPICAGKSSTISASGATTYTWSTGSNSTSIIVTPTSTTVYTLDVTNSCGIYTKTIGITVNPLPTLSITAPSSVCASAVFTVTGSGANNYTWSPTSAFGSPTSSISAAGLNSTQTITLTGRDLAFCYNTATVTVNVNTGPPLSISGTGTICSGASATLVATAGATSYSWSTGATTQSIIVTPTVAGTMYYTVQGTNTAGCSAYTYSPVTIHAPNSLSVSPASPTFCPGFSGYITASGMPTYTWSNSTNSNTCTVSSSSSGPYTLSVSGTNACGIETKTVTIYTAPQITLTILGKDSVCKNIPTTFTVTGANSYNWSAPTSTNGATPTFTFVSVPTLSVIGYDVYSCFSTATKTVTILTTPTVSVSGPVNSCTTGSVILNASGANTYSWSTGATTYSAFVSPTVATIYTVTGTNTVGCRNTKTYTVTPNTGPYWIYLSNPSSTVCVGDSVQLASCCLVTYSWSTGSTNSATYFYPSLGTNVYTLTVSDSFGCYTSTTGVSTGVASPIVSITGNTIVCPGNSTTLTASGANTYTWNTGPNTSSISVAPTTTTTYSVSGKNTTGCKSPTTSITVSIAPVPTPTLTISKDTICTGSSITMMGAPSGGTFAGTFVSGSLFTPTITGNYLLYYNYTNAYGCPGNDSKTATAVICTAISPLLSELNLAVYPNPADNSIFISNTMNRLITISVFDLSGKQISENKTSDNSSLTIDVKLLSMGMYFLKIEREGVSQYLKFLKN